MYAYVYAKDNAPEKSVFLKKFPRKPKKFSRNFIYQMLTTCIQTFQRSVELFIVNS